MTYSIEDACRGCGLCKRYCPADAIRGELRQKHWIIPDLCIDCGACGRVCNSSAVEKHINGTVQYVEHIQPGLWQHPVWDRKVCVSCGICVQACPVGIIDAEKPNGKSSRTPVPILKHPKKCLGCAICADQCPLGAIHMKTPPLEK